MTDNTGWTCPKCSRVHAPFVPECVECNTGTSTVINVPLKPHSLFATDEGDFMCEKCGQRVSDGDYWCWGVPYCRADLRPALD